jgi:hypothetical protein
MGVGSDISDPSAPVRAGSISTGVPLVRVEDVFNDRCSHPGREGITVTTMEHVNIHQGIDLAVLERFAEFASDNPTAVQFILEAVGQYEGRAAHTLASTGPYTLGGERIDRIARRYTQHFGAHKEVEEALGFVDPTDRPEASEVVLSALTSCINTAVSSSALVRGIELQELTTSVSVAWNPFVFLHLSEPAENGIPTGQFSDLRVEITVSADGLTEDDLEYLRHSVQRSAVYNLLTMANPTSPTITAR